MDLTSFMVATATYLLPQDPAATCAVVTVTALWIYYLTWRALYVLATFAVAIRLVGANYHFLSDAIAGGFVGISQRLDAQLPLEGG